MVYPPHDNDPDRRKADERAALTESAWEKAAEMKDELERSFNGEEGKRVVKEAIKEWLDEQLAAVGKWSLTGIAAAMLAALAYIILTSQGWHK